MTRHVKSRVKPLSEQQRAGEAQRRHADWTPAGQSAQAEREARQAQAQAHLTPSTTHTGEYGRAESGPKGGEDRIGLNATGMQLDKADAAPGTRRCWAWRTGTGTRRRGSSRSSSWRGGGGRAGPVRGRRGAHGEQQRVRGRAAPRRGRGHAAQVLPALRGHLAVQARLAQEGLRLRAPRKSRPGRPSRTWTDAS